MHDDLSEVARSDESADGLAGLAASEDPRNGLGAVRALRTLADRLEEVQVANARRAGWSWQQIAEVLQVSRQAVHQKHADVHQKHTHEHRPHRPEGDQEP